MYIFATSIFYLSCCNCTVVALRLINDIVFQLLSADHFKIWIKALNYFLNDARMAKPSMEKNVPCNVLLDISWKTVQPKNLNAWLLGL